MPENEQESNPNEALEKVVSTLKRQRWWIVGAATFIALATIAVSLKLPNRFESESTLVVVQQQISQKYVEPTTTTPVADAVQAMTREVLSRARLAAIIDELGLYGGNKDHESVDALVERMRKDVDIQPLDPNAAGVFSAFKISFSADKPGLAQAVTGRLTSLFIEENLRDRGNQAVKTTAFLGEQLEGIKQKLAEQEQRMLNFKMRNSGALPEQQASNLGAVTELRMQLTNAMSGLNRAQQQHNSYQSLVEGNLARLEFEQSSLLTRYTPKHAEVVKKNQEIATMQSLLDRLKSGATGALPASTGLEDVSIVQLRNQIDNNATELENFSKEERRLTTQIAEYQNRINLTPVKEQELSEILRDYDQYKQDYKDLLKNQQQSQLTTTLEEHQEGQHFRLIDPPTLPSVPSSPKRVKISLGGAGAGIALGLALAFLMDFKDRSLHTEKEVKRSFALPLVVGVPMILTAAEKQQQWRKASVEWLVGTAMLLCVVAAEFYVYRFH